MTPSFRVAVVGASRVGKTTLLTAILSDTHSLLAGTPVTVSMDEPTQSRVRRQEKDLRRAIEVGEFNAAALGGTQDINRYHVALQADGDESVQIPFDLLDYPGAWLDPDERSKYAHAVAEWPNYLDHVRQSIMLLVPIDAAVLMEAVTPRQKAAVGELLGLLDIEDVGRKWAMARQANPYEPAVVVLAPLKCEKYFGDNGGHGHDEARLRARVKEKYDRLLEIIAAETENRSGPVRVVYAPIDTYG
ncbi:MAG: 50S ribosome-binding GTPase, partial [Pseudonocardiales bacterium]|nr:50S ribosome-binding GTPase [Pseudonocardiales bacterium]